jgi:hypothetical protein
MRTLSASLILVSVASALAAAQVAPGSAPESTQTHTMVRAAGMPLRDGALPPGTLTVRVVRGDFSSNVADHAVRIEVAGGAASTARTGPDGRALFAHVAVGAYVTASAVVDGETLQSEAFQMPLESGIRVLLVAGSGTPAAPVAATQADMALPPAPPTEDFTAASTLAPSSSGVAVIRTVLACTTGFVGMLFVLRWRRRIAARAPANPGA